ncbi:Nucleoside hydrolase 3 [Orobanche gracilis]
MMIQSCIFMVMMGLIGSNINYVDGKPHRILIDTDVDFNDVLALLYILKLDISIFDLKAITINANSWTNAGHAVNEVYDLLYMMGRDDIAVGVGGEGGILDNGTISSNVGGYLPIIDQGEGTAGYCRYSQVIPLGPRGKLYLDTKYGFRKSFLPQGNRRYSPLHQPTAQQVMIDTISEGPTTLFILGASTNLAIFLMSNPQLRKNIEHIYILGGGIGARNSNLRCCNYSGNVFTGYNTAPNSEYTMFSDPFAAYQVIHSGVPVTLVPLDATDTIPITNEFLDEFEKNQHTYEAQYCFNILKMVRDTWFTDEFFKIFFMWDSLLAGVATSIMLKQNNINGENDFAEMKYMNITVITSNEPYGILDPSNPFYYGSKKPKFNLTKNGVHSGRVVTGATDAFCHSKTHGCKDGYTPEVTGPEGVRVLVAVKAKPNHDASTILDKEFYKSFIRRTSTVKAAIPKIDLDLFVGEILGAVILAEDNQVLKTSYAKKKLEVYATGVESEDGHMVINENKKSNSVNVLEHVLDHVAYYDAFANRLGDENQSAVVGSSEEHNKMWSAPQN